MACFGWHSRQWVETFVLKGFQNAVSDITRNLFNSMTSLWPNWSSCSTLYYSATTVTWAT